MPGQPLTIETAVLNIVHLRRAERLCGEEAARELEPVIDGLERFVGPTV